MVKATRGQLMKTKRARTATTKDTGFSSVRASISFPAELYATLEGLAKQKKVSLAWVVRDAAETYVAHQKTRSEQR